MYDSIMVILDMKIPKYNKENSHNIAEDFGPHYRF
jgi:hypothetical protein